VPARLPTHHDLSIGCCWLREGVVNGLNYLIIALRTAYTDVGSGGSLQRKHGWARQQFAALLTDSERTHQGEICRAIVPCLPFAEKSRCYRQENFLQHLQGLFCLSPTRETRSLGDMSSSSPHKRRPPPQHQTTRNLTASVPTAWDLLAPRLAQTHPPIHPSLLAPPSADVQPIR
jgi:hypothetical protein